MKNLKKIALLSVFIFALGLYAPKLVQASEDGGEVVCWTFGTSFEGGGYYKCFWPGQCKWKDDYVPNDESVEKTCDYGDDEEL